MSKPEAARARHASGSKRQAKQPILPGGERYVLKLYVTGQTPRSAQAIANIQAVCAQHLPGRYDLEIIDLYQQPSLACTEQILVAPTLIKKLPLPVRLLVGNLSQVERVLQGLDVCPQLPSP